nr:MAG TPA: hypothetical protein [Caudoviricetes sp.]
MGASSGSVSPPLHLRLLQGCGHQIRPRVADSWPDRVAHARGRG